MMFAIFLGLPLLLLAMALFYMLVIYSPGAQRDWERLPAKEDYVARHGSTCCRQCGAAQTLDVGLLRYTDFRRKILCATCKTSLWREEEQ